MSGASRAVMSPWMNTAQAAEYLCYTGKHPLRSVYDFIARHKIVVRHDGTRVLLSRADVIEAVERGRRVSPASLANLRPRARLGKRVRKVSA